LTLEASYQPPGRLLGEVVDLVLLHRLAKASVHDFVQRTGRPDRLLRGGKMFVRHYSILEASFEQASGGFRELVRVLQARGAR
jgi:hypothetical protein